MRLQCISAPSDQPTFKQALEGNKPMTGSKILWINPVGTDLYDAPIAAALALEAGPGTTVDVASFPGPGPQHLEHNAFEMVVAPQLMGTIRWGEEAGYDAAIIGCFYDPGLRGAREVAQRMAVTAPAEATLHIANTLGERPSILVGRRKWIPEMRENVTKYGFASRLASFRVLGMGVDEFQKDAAHTEERIMEEARLAVEQDGADVIILGCTIEFGFYKQVQEEIGVPVVDAIVAPLRYAEFLADLRDRHGWAHSKALGYEGPSGDSWDWIPAMEPNLTRSVAPVS